MLTENFLSEGARSRGNLFFKVYALALLCFIALNSVIVPAQQPAVLTPPPKPIGALADKNKTSPSRNPNAPNATNATNQLAFTTGEKLTYNVSWGTYSMAARIELRVSERGNFFGIDSYQIKAKVETPDNMHALFGGIDNQYTSYISADTAVPHKMINSVRQGLKLEEETVGYDPNSKTAVFSDGKQLRISGEAFDIPSLIYSFRLQPFANSGKKKFVIIYNKEAIPVVADIKGRERISVQTGVFEAVKIKFTPQKNFSGKSIIVWFSDDDRRIPVAATVEFPFGNVRVELTSSETPVTTSAQLAEIKYPAYESGVPAIGINKGNGNHDNNNPLPPMPFAVGERLHYDVGWGSFDSAARAVMEVRRIGVLNNYRVFEFTGELTNSAATKDFLSLNESLSSYAAIDNKLAPMMIEWKLRDGKQVTRGSVAPPRAGSFDLVSLFYSIRTLSMTPNSIQQLSFFDADKQVMSISIKTVKTEVINTKLGNRDTIQLDIYSVGQTPVLLAQAWLANDNSRIPLYFVTRTSFGELRFQISKIF